MTAASDFAAAILAGLGAAPDPRRIVPGRFIRFAVNGKRGDDAGWARLFEDERGGVFGDWRTGFHDSWQSKTACKRGTADREAFSRQVALANAEREREQLARHQQAAGIAAAIWGSAVPVARHAYAELKGCDIRGLRMQRGHQGGCSGSFYVTGEGGRPERLKGDLLLVPMHGADQRLWSLQAIDTNGRKSVIKGGRTKGLFHLVGRSLFHDVDLRRYAGDVAIAEGLATASSVVSLSGSPVFAAFNAGNLVHAAQAIRQRLPLARITIAGDVDRSGVGQLKAEQAASAVSGFVSLPPLTATEIEAGASDWNDYVRLHPLGAAKEMQA